MKKYGVSVFLLFTLMNAYVFIGAPEEATQGLVQKIFYIHVPSAITMYLGFFVGFLGSLMYLIKRELKWDHIAIAGVETGLLFCSIVLVTGPIWARPVWGAYWTWEPRLTSTFLLFLMMASYLMLRNAFGKTNSSRKMSAVLAMLAFCNVPLIHLSVRLWRGVHPTVLAAKDGGITPHMQLVFVGMLIAEILVWSFLFAKRFQLALHEERKN